MWRRAGIERPRRPATCGRAARSVLRAARLALAAGLLVSSSARGDSKEVYAVLGYVPSVNRYELPASGSGSTTAVAGGADLSAYYGVRNTLHLGARLRAAINSNVHLGDVRVNLPDGSVSPGDAYLDHRSLGLGALALYRMDTGLHLAPALEVEAGFTSHQYRRIAHVPVGVAYTIPLSNVSETVFHAATALLVEYRLGNTWTVSAGLGVQFEPGARIPWAVNLPLRVGVIW